MPSYTEQMQNIVDEYVEAGGAWPATARDMAGWAINNKKWVASPSALINRCAEDLARAMREELIRDPQGRAVRAKHVAQIQKDGDQFMMWADIRTASRDHMAAAFQLRRQQVVGDCRQLKNDVDSFNDNRSPVDPIQMSFDFTLDLIELEAIGV